MPRPKRVTLKHIADRLQLTVHTVSKALRGLPGMSEATRREVFAVARELGYNTKAQEQGLSAEHIVHAAGKPRRFVMLMPADHHFHHMQFNGLHLRLHELGHAVQSLVIPGSLSDESMLLDWLERIGVLHADGLFLSPVVLEWIESALVRLDVPKVLINNPPAAAEVDSVIWDVQHAVHLSVDALCKAGHQRILYVGDTDGQRGFRLRRQAFLAAAARHGLHVEEKDQLERRNMGKKEWLDLLIARLQSGSYTAVLSAIPSWAEWVFMAADSAGLRIPEDLSLVGMEHEELVSHPNLTRPILLLQETGQRAAELMLRRIANPLAPFEHVRLLGAFFQGATIASANTIKTQD